MRGREGGRITGSRVRRGRPPEGCSSVEGLFPLIWKKQVTVVYLVRTVCPPRGLYNRLSRLLTRLDSQLPMHSDGPSTTLLYKVRLPCRTCSGSVFSCIAQVLPSLTTTRLVFLLPDPDPSNPDASVGPSDQYFPYTNKKVSK